MENILETVTIPEHPEIQHIKDTMLENGAIASLMSGSGPTVFGIFDDIEQAKTAKEKCRELPYRCFVFVTDFYR
jgi:4-diphosphocytidyl-2-C-methyl-D-erythritol kinase